MSVTINIGNGNLGGQIQTNDGIVGMVLTGVTESGGYTLGTPILVNSMADVTAAGITEANNPFAYKELNDFYYGVSGPTALFVMLLASTVTVASMCDKTNANGAVALLNFAITNGTPIKALGCMSDDTAVTVGTITAGLNPAVYTAAANMEVLIAQYRTSQNPFRGIVGGTSYTGVPSALTAQNVGTTNNTCAILIGDNSTTYSSKGAALGEWLGLRSQLPSHRLVSRVKNGPAWNQTAYLDSAQVTATNTDLATISGKGYITWRTLANTAGFFFSTDVTLTVSTDDYQLMPRGLVMDKAQIIAYTLFVQETDDEIPTVPGTGLIDPGYAADLSKSIEKAITDNMVAAGNITGVTCFIDPAQNVVSTGDLIAEITIDADGYSQNIIINLAYGL